MSADSLLKKTDNPSLLFIGFGQLGRAALPKLLHLGYQVTAVARRELNDVLPLEYWRGSIDDDHIQKLIASREFDVVIITMTPSGRDAEAYRHAYFNNVNRLIKNWRQGFRPRHVFYVSSTRVYGQNRAEWIDEQSETQPLSEQGKILLETEQLLLDSEIPTTVVRFSGIYGDGRDYLIKQVVAGRLEGDSYTNRIHERDCVNVFVHLIKRFELQLPLASIYLASDLEPALSGEVRNWIALTLKELACFEKRVSNYEINLPYLIQDQEKGKRCKSQRLMDEGFVWEYPNYQTGYTYEVSKTDFDKNSES